MMNNTLCVSTPRSGHHYLLNMLVKYFSGEISFPLTSGDYTVKATIDLGKPLKAGELIYCEYYRHCRASPCPNPGTNFQKAHDLSLDLKKLPNLHYLVQIRDPLETLQSWFELSLANGWGGCPDSAAGWQSFALSKMEYWLGFLWKWVVNKPDRGILIPYSDLYHSSARTLRNILLFLDPDKPVNDKYLEAIVAWTHREHKRKRNISDFKYYESSFFDRLADRIRRDPRFMALPESIKTKLFDRNPRPGIGGVREAAGRSGANQEDAPGNKTGSAEARYDRRPGPGEKKYFITYGDRKFERSKRRLASEVERLGIFDNVIAYGPADYDSAFIERHSAFIKNNPRGNGYYLWKPYFIVKTLEAMNDNDILVYADAGCRICPQHRDRLIEYFDRVRKDGLGLLNFQMNDGRRVECAWTKSDLAKRMGVLGDERIMKTGQICATVLMMRKCRDSVKIMGEYYSLCAEDYHFIDDSPSVLANHPDFIEHRYDQSVLSILLKKHGSQIMPDETLPIGSGPISKNHINDNQMAPAGIKWIKKIIKKAIGLKTQRIDAPEFQWENHG